ncbi:MAG: hypothetical protein D6834_01730 [Aquificota bacterium]|nr:MAG: hypothetical protein D6834_01730 [Aquificota bacterium]
MKKLFFFMIFIIFISSCGTQEETLSNISTGFHNQGKPCLSCHGYQYRAQDVEEFEDVYGEDEGDTIKFNIGGTIFKLINAKDNDWKNAAEYHYVVLKTDTKSYKTNIGRGSGNFWLNASINSEFIVEVYNKDGKLVNYTFYRHKPTYTNCNSCHTVYGKNGAPGRIINY